MKHLILAVMPVMIFSSSYAQEISQRISFIIGPGASLVTDRLFDNPSVNPTNNFVMIENGPRVKTNLAIGIAYTPHISDITRKVRFLEEDGSIGEKNVLESVPRGRTFAAYLNPLAFSKVSEAQPFFNMIDFGVGYGYRTAGGVLIMATTEFFSVRQPRNWFVDQFRGMNRPYEIDGAPQKSIDINDDNIFRSRGFITFGFKVCYTFDIIKNYLQGYQGIEAARAAPAGNGGERESSESPPVEK